MHGRGSSATSLHIPCTPTLCCWAAMGLAPPCLLKPHLAPTVALRPPLSCPAQRTPAKQFFPRHLYRPLKAALLEYGARELGCLGLSPIWLRWAAGAAGAAAGCCCWLQPAGPTAGFLLACLLACSLLALLSHPCLSVTGSHPLPLCSPPTATTPAARRSRGTAPRRTAPLPSAFR